MKRICKELFDFKVKDNLKISCSKNEIYNQLLLYIFSAYEKDLIILTSNINEASKIYSDISTYLSNVYFFPDDDYLTKKSIAISKDLTLYRMNFLNNFSDDNRKIVVCHTNSFLKKLPNPSLLKDKKIKIIKGKKIDKKELERRLNDIGYVKESIVSLEGEYAPRGFVVDIYPISNNNPIRIEFFDNEIESIKEFDPNTQLSIKGIDEILINPINDEYKDASSSLINYLNDPAIIVNDYNQVLNMQESLYYQIEYYKDENNDYFKAEDLLKNKSIYIDLIDNAQKYDYVFKAEELPYFNDNINQFIKHINEMKKNKKEVYFYTEKDKYKNIFLENNIDIKIINQSLLRGFIYNNICYYSDKDLKKVVSQNLKLNNYKFGKKVSSFEDIKVGDYVVHKKHGIGIYMGITTISKNGQLKDYILLKYKGTDKLYLSVEDINKLYKYSSKEGVKPRIYSLNSNEWKKVKLRIKSKIIDLTEKLLKLYKERANIKTTPYEKDTPLQLQFEKDFEFEETLDQVKTTKEIKEDLEKDIPMDRLLCGDVGYGKTEVIFRAIFKTIMNDKQVMYLCPTTLLSHQQYQSACARFEKYGVKVEVLNRYTTHAEASKILNDLKEHKIDVLFGTHRLLSPDVVFKDLGLLVIDEEHRFGVSQKERIKEIKTNVNVLSVSATPIPRSLQMSLVGMRDLSLIETAPKNRYPVQTYVMGYDENIIKEVILKEKNRGGQVFILYNRVESMPLLIEKYKKLIPNVSFSYAHGKMKKTQIQDIMKKFTEGQFDCLITTTIIENGIDIPNANTLLVIDADYFGLSQLYQIRGRVGRSDRIAYAYLMYRKNKTLGDDAVKRLDSIKELTALGSGYKIAYRDLSIRGAGDILGPQQAGFIDSIGVDLYLELMRDGVTALDDEENDLNVDEVETHVDRDTVNEEELIIDIYKKIDEIDNDETFNMVKNEIIDRYGKLDNKLYIYMCQEYAEKLLNKLNISFFENTSKIISLKITKEIYTHLIVEDLFVNTTKISSKFIFTSKNDYIIIKIPKIASDKHYMECILELLKYINKNIK